MLQRRAVSVPFQLLEVPVFLGSWPLPAPSKLAVASSDLSDAGAPPPSHKEAGDDNACPGNLG